MPAASHAFGRALHLDQVGDGVVRGATDPQWANMVGPFGGITAAVLLRAVEFHPDRIGDPRVFLRRGGFIPAGTVSLTTYFHADEAQIDAVGNDFVLGSAHANAFSRGYFDQSAHVWSRDGVLLTSSHQLVYFKD
jgi:hypothetical protein